MTATTTTPELTAEQLRAAAELNTKVRDYESQGSLATFAQARALQQIRDEQLYKGIQLPSGNGFFSNFGDYVNWASTKSPSTISQNISVVSAFHGYPDEQLAEAGPEKLYIAWKMKGEGIYTTLEDALTAARTKSRADLMELRKSGSKPKLSLVFLSALKVTQAQSDRFAATFEEKFRASYAQVHDGEHASDSKVADFFLDVVGGLPNDFLLMAAAGEGGAAPEMSDGFRPTDITPTDAIYHIADVLLESGENPEQIIEMMRTGLQSRIDRFEIEERERKEAEAEASKAEKERAREESKWAGRLRKVAQRSTIDFSDGAQAEVLDTGADNGEGVNSIFLKGIKDGSTNVFSEKGEEYKIDAVATLGIVGINKPAPAPKEKKKAAPKAEAAPAEEPTIGISKAQQTGRKAKKSSKPAPADNNSGEE